MWPMSWPRQMSITAATSVINISPHDMDYITSKEEIANIHGLSSFVLVVCSVVRLAWGSFVLLQLKYVSSSKSILSQTNYIWVERSQGDKVRSVISTAEHVGFIELQHDFLETSSVSYFGDYSTVGTIAWHIGYVRGPPCKSSQVTHSSQQLTALPSPISDVFPRQHDMSSGMVTQFSNQWTKSLKLKTSKVNYLINSLCSTM